MYQPTVNVDLDGCVYPFSEVQHEWMIYRDIISEDTDLTNIWEIWDYYGIPKGLWETEFRRGVEAGVIWRRGEPVEGAREALWRLSDHDINLRIVTRRLVHKFSHSKVIKNTIEWLEDYNIPYWDIAFVGKSNSKSGYLADFAIDDHPKYVQESIEGGALAWLFPRPFNRDVTDLPEVKDWEQFADWVIDETLAVRNLSRTSTPLPFPRVDEVRELFSGSSPLQDRD